MFVNDALLGVLGTKMNQALLETSNHGPQGRFQSYSLTTKISILYHYRDKEGERGERTSLLGVFENGGEEADAPRRVNIHVI